MDIQVFDFAHKNDDKIVELEAQVAELERQKQVRTKEFIELTIVRDTNLSALLRIIPRNKIIMDSESEDGAGYGARDQYFAKYVTKGGRTLYGHSYGLTNKSCESAQIDVLKQMTRDEFEEFLQ
jgi:hypothetical protein